MVLKQKLIDSNFVENEDNNYVPQKNYDRSTTFSRLETFTRAFTFDRTLTQAIGLDFESDEAWTKKLLVEYVEVQKQGNEGDIPIPTPFGSNREFWRMMLFSGAFGCIIGVFGLIFMNFVDEVPKKWINNGDFDSPDDCDFYRGKKYWIIITTATGFAVGCFRYIFTYPDNLPGLFKDINDCHVEPLWAPMTAFLSMMSLSGGASLGPEAALGNLGGGIATYVSKYARFDDDDSKLVVLSGMTAALGALFPSPALGVLMMYELGNPPKSYMESIIVLSFSSIISFLIFYKLADKTWIDHIQQNLALAYNWEFEDWQCWTGFVIGIISAVLSFMIILFIGICKQIFLRMKTRLSTRSKALASIIAPTLGGLVIGLTNWALPLTVGNGSLTLKAIISFGYQGLLSDKLILCSIAAKMFTLGVSMNCGFIGGFIFPQIQIATMVGMYMHSHYDYIPVGLCVSCFIAGIPAGICPMPFTLACLAIFLMNFGLYQTAPIFIATITSYTLICGSGLFGALASRQQQRLQNATRTEGIDEESIKRKGEEKLEEESFAISQYLGARGKK